MTRAAALALAALACGPPAAPAPAVAPAQLLVRGSARQTDPDLSITHQRPVAVLVDAGPRLVLHDGAFVASAHGIVRGTLRRTSTADQVAYEIPLPTQPAGTAVPVGQGDSVQVWTVEILNDLTGPADAGPLSAIEQLATRSHGSLRLGAPRGASGARDAAGGAFLVFAGAPARVPAGPGPDARAFTPDDPLQPIAPGWSLVSLDSTPYTVTTVAPFEVPLHEPPSAAPLSLAGHGMAAGFDAFIALMVERYAYTAQRGADWQVWAAELMPQVLEAEAARDWARYYDVYRQLAVRIRDSHVNVSAIDAGGEFLRRHQELPTGLEGRVHTLGDGAVVTLAPRRGSAAARAGFRALDRIVEVDGAPVGQYVAAEDSGMGLGTGAIRRALALDFSQRFGTNRTFLVEGVDGDTRTLTIATPPFESVRGALLALRAAHAADDEGDSVRTRRVGTAGVIRLPSFLSPARQVPALERALASLAGTERLVLDLRGNSGGAASMMLHLTSLFFGADRPFTTAPYVQERFEPAAGSWVAQPPFGIAGGVPLHGGGALPHYRGRVIVLVDSRCNSACEYLARYLQHQRGATVVSADASTAGGGGAVRTVVLPGARTPAGLNAGQFTFTVTRDLLRQDGTPLIQGRGVAPDVRVSLTMRDLQRMLEGSDPVLERALTLP